MIQRQVIVTWYTPEEKTPGENEGVIATVSGDVNGAIIFDRAIVLMCWSKEYGWYSEEYSFTHLTVHAWCDLEAYEGWEGGENMMDLESAIKHCEEVADTPCFTDEEAKCYSEHRQLAEWLKELKAYKVGESRSEIPNTCGDVISRQAAIEAIEALQRPIMREESNYYQFKFSGMSEARDAVEKLPSVTPQPKMGRWIAQDIHNCHTSFKCSECDYIHSFMHLYGKPTADYTYCPNCGAKMEVEE